MNSALLALQPRNPTGISIVRRKPITVVLKSAEVEMNTHRCKVLLVDDHDPIRDALRTLLSSYDDVEIIGEARDGEEAIICVASCHPDIILMDINMPRMNGIQATTVIKKSRKEMAIIGLCLVHDTYTIDAFLKAGALAVVSKERLDDLHATIQRACADRGFRASAPSA